MVFKDGSQAVKWIFTQEQLYEKRKEANRKCIEQMKFYDENLDTSLCITDLEEGKIVDSLIHSLRPFYRKFKPALPNHVYGLSVTYLRRFFLKYSFMDFRPKEIFIACIFLACKIAEVHISMDNFLKNIPKNSHIYHDFIYNSEMFLIDELEYDLWLYTPYEPFKAYMVEVRAFEIELRYEERDKLIRDNESLCQHIKSGLTIIDDWYQTDLMMMYSPQYIALAAVEAINFTNPQLLKEFIKKKVSKDESHFILIMKVIHRIREFIYQRLAVHRIDKFKIYESRVNQYKNPKYNVESAVYQDFKKEFDDKYNKFE